MTGRDRPMNDAELDALLGAWMHEGPDSGPDRIAERAMLEVATTPQESARVTAMWAWMAESPLAWAAVILVLAIGLGVVLGPVLVGDETPTPSPSPSPAPDALVPYVSEEAGYELLVPANWLETDSGFPDVKLFSGPGGELMISYGQSVLEGGAVTFCAPELPDYNTCGTLEITYSIPYDPAASMENFRPSLEGSLDRCDGGCPVTHTDTTLDGEPAGQFRLVISERQLTYVYAIHEFRPILLYWSEPLATADEQRVEAMRGSFAFIGPSPVASQEPVIDPTALVTYTNVADGYELSVPGTWAESAAALLDPAGNPYPGVQALGTGGAEASIPGVMISMGEPDGSIFSDCHGPLQEAPPPLPPPECREFVATSLDELQAGLTTIPPYYTGAEGLPTEESGDLVLGAEPGRFERPVYLTDGHGCLGCPWILSHAFTIHGGRPVVLAFDYWNIAFERISAEYLEEMLASFTFLD